MTILGTPNKPISFDGLIQDISTRYHFGRKGRSFVEEAADIIARQPGGVHGFLERFKNAGFTIEVSSWLEGTDPVPLSGQEIEQTLGSNAICEIANKAGVSQRFARTVLGYAIPKIISTLAKNGFFDVGVPPSFLHIDQIPKRVWRQFPLGGREASRLTEVLIPSAALLIFLGSLGYFVALGQMRHRGSVTQSSPVTAQTAPAAIPPAPLIPARLELTNKNGLIIYSGTVGDDATRTAITDSLKTVFGAGKISGELAVDQHAGSADWRKDLNVVLDNFKTPGSLALFEDNAISIGGTIPDGVRGRIISSLKSTLGSQFAYAALPGSSTTETAMISPEPEPGVSNSVSAPNQSTLNLHLPVIYFTPNSADVRSGSKALLREAAGSMKQLPAGMVVRISGFADSTGNPAANKSLSQRRADAVRQVLINAGINPAVLSAKGYGSILSVASSENTAREGRSASTLESRLREDRRVEFRLAK
jgi:OOP family OmpA-OmpF porin